MAQGHTCDCKRDWPWVRFPLEEIFFFLFSYFHFFALATRQSAALSSATQHAMPSKFGGKWVTDCLNIKLPLPTLYGIQREGDLFYYRGLTGKANTMGFQSMIFTDLYKYRKVNSIRNVHKLHLKLATLKDVCSRHFSINTFQ